MELAWSVPGEPVSRSLPQQVVIMSTRTLALVFVGLAALGTSTARAQPTATPVRATDPILVKEDRFQYLDYLLTNDSAVAVTAWGVMHTMTRNDGTSSDGGHATDVYKSFERGCDGQERSRCFVPPGQARRVRFMVSSKEDYVSVTLRLEFAIFADGSGVGSERWRADYFEHRNAESRGWKQVLTILLAEREEVGPGADGARAAARELDKGIPERGSDRIREYESGPRKLAAGNLRRGVERPEQADRVLDDMIAMARTEIEMLEPHLTARP